MSPHTPRCRCGAVMLGPGIAHCWHCHGEWPTIEGYNAHLLAMPRAGDMPDFRCRSVSTVVAIAEETLDKMSDLDVADACGRLAYCCAELLKLVEDRETGLEKMLSDIARGADRQVPEDEPDYRRGMCEQGHHARCANADDTCPCECHR